MPCYHPLQAVFSVRPDGKKDIQFSNSAGRLFSQGVKPLGDSNLSLPCGRCMGCRLERSRQWALRMVHESKSHENNCFVTLTFNDEHLAKMCPGGSLVRKHVQDFMKRLRQKFANGFCYFDRDGKELFYSSDSVRVFYCGEYGENLARPHYHLCLFNCYFPDQVFWKTMNGFKYFNSSVLSSLWSLDGVSIGHTCVTDFSFETAAYVARYCTKKITGSEAEAHYQGRLPEFCGMSTKPGIGRFWFDKFGASDVLPTDTCIVRGAVCKPPRYYDKLREQLDPVAFAKAKELRVKRAVLKSDDNSFDRLRVKEKCMDARVRLLVRNLEK